MRMIFRLIFWTLLFYLVLRLLRLWLGRSRTAQQGRSSVQGQSQKKSLDLSNADVEDAKFHEVKK